MNTFSLLLPSQTSLEKLFWELNWKFSDFMIEKQIEFGQKEHECAEKWSAFGHGIIPFANSTLVNLIWQPKMPRGPPLTFAKMCMDQKKIKSMMKADFLHIWKKTWNNHYFTAPLEFNRLLFHKLHFNQTIWNQVKLQIKSC